MTQPAESVPPGGTHALQPSVQVDVLIAGGGPCGLMLANELGRRGIRCLLVDRKPGTAFNPQANATQARTMEHYRRLGFAHKVRAQGLPADHPTDIAYLTRFAGHELARLQLPTARQATEVIKTMGGSWSAAELPHRVSQKFVEVVLREEAQALPGIELRYGWNLVDFDDDGAKVTARVAPVDGSAPEQWVQAQYMLAADGARSGVRARFGIEWEGVTGLKRSFMGGRMFAAYLRVPQFYERNRNDRAWMYVQVHPQLRSFVMSVDGVSEFAFHTQVPEGVDPDSLTADDAKRWFAQAYGDTDGQTLDVEVLSTGHWLAGHALVAQAFRRGRVFIGGDAAHLFTPTGGLGYNTAVEDAVNLGWKLAAVLNGHAPPALLDSYAAERKPLALRNTGYARGFADSIGLFDAVPELDDDTPAGAAARAAASDYLNGHARREFNIPGVTFGGRYDASPVICHDDTPPPPDAANSYEPSAKPGGRPPHLWLPDGSSLYDHFGFDWTLLVIDAPTPADESAVQRFRDTAAQQRLPLKVLRLDAPDVNVRLRALYDSTLVLIRPDHVIAWRGEDAREARAVWARVLGLDLTRRQP